MIEKIMKAKAHFFKYNPLIHELVIRDIEVKYRRNILGYLWSLLNPLLMLRIGLELSGNLTCCATPF